MEEYILFIIKVVSGEFVGLQCQSTLQVGKEQMAAAQRIWSHLTSAQKDSLKEPIDIALMTGHMFGPDYARGIADCWLHNVQLNCAYLPAASRHPEGHPNQVATAADALWYHGPSICGSMPVSTNTITKYSCHNK